MVYGMGAFLSILEFVSMMFRNFGVYFNFQGMNLRLFKF